MDRSNSRCRVAFILPSFAGGGAERVALTLASAIDATRFEPVIVVLDRAGPLERELSAGVPIIDLCRKRLRTAVLPLLRQLRSHRIDVAVSTIGYVNLALLALRPFLPRTCRIVVREANIPQATIDRAPVSWLTRFGYHRLYPLADRIVCPSQEILRALAVEMELPLDRLVLLPNPVDGERIRRAPPVRAPGSGMRFVAAGRLTYQKGWDRLIEAFAAVPDPLAHLTILGDGPDRHALESQITARGLTKRVALMGFITDPWSYYRGADAFVISSRWEGMPNAALEALAAGTPVIATPESGGIVDVARDAAREAIAIAKAGPDFVEAMSAVKTREDRDDRPSLLPRQYELSAAAGRFADLLCTR